MSNAASGAASAQSNAMDFARSASRGEKEKDPEQEAYKTLLTKVAESNSPDSIAVLKRLKDDPGAMSYYPKVIQSLYAIKGGDDAHAKYEQDQVQRRDDPTGLKSLLQSISGGSPPQQAPMQSQTQMPQQGLLTDNATTPITQSAPAQAPQNLLAGRELDISQTVNDKGERSTTFNLAAPPKSDLSKHLADIKSLRANGDITAQEYSDLRKSYMSKETGTTATHWEKIEQADQGTTAIVLFDANGNELKRSIFKTGSKEKAKEGDAWQLPDGTIQYFPKEVGAKIPTGAYRVGIGPSAASLFGPGKAGAMNTDVSGPEFLSTLQPGVADQVKALAEGRMQFPSGFALKSDYWQNMLQAVSQYDPGFDAINYNSRAKTRQSFTSGTDSNNITALNTALAHLQSLKTAYDGLENGNFPSLNVAANWLGTQFGSKKIQKSTGSIKTLGEGVAGELAKVFRQTGMSEGEINAWRDQTKNTGATPEQVNALMQSAIDLMVGRLQALGSKYTQGMGISSNGIDLLSPKAQETLVALKPDLAGEVQSLHKDTPNATPPESAAANPAGDQITVTAPDGTVLTFPNQQAADQFKQAAGIK
jgi:hypothetical protein